MRYLFSITTWIVIVTLTVLLFFVVLLVTIIFMPFDKKRKIAHAQCYWWAGALIKFNPFWNVKISGLENIDRKETYVIVANHQSLADIIVLYRTRIQFKWVAKESLFWIPFIGWNLSLIRHIKLMRGRLGSIKRVYRDAANWLRNDISVLFFPEGTRSDSDKMNVFQNGAFKLAIKEKRPILPIKVEGTREAIAKGSWIFKSNVVGKITVNPPVDTSEFNAGDFSKLRDIVYGILQPAGAA